MNTKSSSAVLAALCLGAGLAGGYAWHAWRAGSAGDVRHATAVPASAAGSATQGSRKILYWYDPMAPQQRFDKPGKSPFMDMPLVPKYADEATGAASVAIDPRVSQALGWRTATVQRRPLGAALHVVGTVLLNERDVAVVQARAAGFVERVARLAPGDVVQANTRVADILVPEWAGAQQEFLAVRGGADAALVAAARQRLKLLGMPDALIRQVEVSGKVIAVSSVTAPIGGVIDELAVRQGMTVSPGMTLMRINGLSTVWVEAAVPQGQAQRLQPGQPVEVTAGDEGAVLQGKVAAILPQTNADTRTVRARIELPNPGGRLRAGMFVNVVLRSAPSESLLVPSEAVVRTGRRSIVYTVQGPGLFKPVEVETGDTDGEMTVVRRGLDEGQQVVASGQFLLDSEASLQGLTATAGEAPLPRTKDETPPTGALPASPRYTTQGTITAIDADGITLDHAAVPALGWDAMAMSFPVADPSLLQGRRVGERVSFTFTVGDDGPVIQAIKPTGPSSQASGGAR